MQVRCVRLLPAGRLLRRMPFHVAFGSGIAG
jgi:hypothetical protein